MRILRQRSDLRSIGFVLLVLAAYAVQWTGLVRDPLLYAASFPLVFIACIINHNHQHHPTFVPRRFNRLFGVLLTWAMGFPASAAVAMHNDNHHVHNNHEEDFVRVAIVGFRWNLLNVLLFPLIALIHYAPVKSRTLRAWRTDHPGLYRQLGLERLMLYPLLVLLMVLDPFATLLYLILPQFAGQWGILAINHVQHAGCDPDSEYNHSRNFVSRWLNWWFFNNGYHTAHHLRPGLHWSLLPAFHAEICERIDTDLQRRSLAFTLVEFYLWPGHGPLTPAKGTQP